MMGGYLEHGKFKYIDKVRTKSGKWRYIYQQTEGHTISTNGPKPNTSNINQVVSSGAVPGQRRKKAHAGGKYGKYRASSRKSNGVSVNPKPGYTGPMTADNPQGNPNWTLYDWYKRTYETTRPSKEKRSHTFARLLNRNISYAKLFADKTFKKVKYSGVEFVNSLLRR